MPTDTPNRHAFTDALKRGLYEAVFRRRDIREFISDPIPDEVLARVLIAAHHAASVGFTQPWDFIVVRDLERRRRVKEVFEAERQKNAAQFSGERREKYLSLKLEGILEAPLNLIVTCKPDRFGPAVLGKLLAGGRHNSRGQHAAFVTRTGCHRSLGHKFHHSVNFLLR